MTSLYYNAVIATRLLSLVALFIIIFLQGCSSKDIQETMLSAAADSGTPANKRLLPSLDKEETPKVKKTARISPDQKDAPICNTPLPTAAISTKGIIKTPKRNSYLSWDEYFLAIAILSSKRSKDPQSPSGACIVDDQNRVVGVGYNGFPRGCPDDVFPWKSSSETTDLHSKNPYLCHAITNAICNKCSDEVTGCRLYVMAFPCSDCAKVIIQSRITEVVILQKSGKEETDSPVQDRSTLEEQASRILLDMAGVKVRYFKPSMDSITLNFVSKMAPSTADTVELSAAASCSSCSGKSCCEDPSKKIARDLLLNEAKYDASKVEDNGKRKDSISWQDYFMAMAFLTAERSKDPNTQVGACIVDSEKRIIGLGYNGFPRGCSDDQLPWARGNANELFNKYLFVCHAEVNAILNKGSANVKGASIYVALFPCENCAKMIIQSGIREVVYMSDCYHETDGARASRILLQSAGVKLRHYVPRMQKMILNFEDKA